MAVMRKTIGIEAQMKFGQVDISAIRLDFRCRDEIPQLLRGLQFIYTNHRTREEVFSILAEEVPAGSIRNGRPGMHLWQILVLSVLRVNCNWDWDKIHFMANTHGLIRQMMGIGEWDGQSFSLQTIKDNIALLKPETLEKISALTVGEGHRLVKKKDENELMSRCDSFVVETNVHYPTDINLLLDAMRKVVYLVARLCPEAGIRGWRKSSDNFLKIKRLYRRCQKMKHSTSRDDAKKLEREKLTAEAFRAYLDVSEAFLGRARRAVAGIAAERPEFHLEIAEIENYMSHAARQIGQARRRALDGEAIPHGEKVFSVFEEHTEWISKGKAGVPFELGLRVCILEDQHGFILHHRVMEHEEDVDVAVPVLRNALKDFPCLRGCSFDKGFWSPENKKTLDGLLGRVVLPKKGKLSIDDKDREHSDEFIYYRHKHSAVESGINALENHGLDRCLDRGIDGFRRYVAMSALGRNLQKLGAMLQAQEVKRRKRKRPGAGVLEAA
jgi:hypothetical protein